MRSTRLCRESATPTWLAQAPLDAAVISCCVLPVAQRKDLVADGRRTVFVASGFCSRRARTALELGSHLTRRVARRRLVRQRRQQVIEEGTAVTLRGNPRSHKVKGTTASLQSIPTSRRNLPSHNLANRPRRRFGAR